MRCVPRKARDQGITKVPVKRYEWRWIGGIGRFPSRCAGVLRWQWLCSARGEIGGSKFHDGAATGFLIFLLVGIFLAAFLGFRRWSRPLRPDAIDVSSVGSESAVIAEEAAFGVEGLFGPGIVGEGASLVGGAGENDDLGAILRSVAAIVEDNIHRGVDGIDREPLKKLFRSVVDGIVVHARRSRPMLAFVIRSRKKDVEIAVSVVAPGDIETLAVRVDGDLGKSVGALEGVDVEHDRRGVNDGASSGKGLAAVA